MTSTLENDSSRTSSVFLRYDLPASLVVFLVALPLSLGIAIASDAPPLAGLIAAIVGGVVAGALGGSPLQVSGPAAGLTVIVAGLVAEFGWAVTCAITVCAGLLQIVFGLSRFGRAALAISPMVVHAMLAGIGITIALQQVHVLLGGDSHSSAWENIAMLPEHLGHADAAGMLIGILVIAILFAWRWAPAALRPVPGPLVAVVAATVVAALFAPNVARIELGGSLLEALQLPNLPEGRWGAFALGVITVALIASVESLLTAVAVDRMAPGNRSNLDRELVGQGAANMISGAVGGLPVTGVIVRSSANVAAGAKTRASAIMHGVWVLVFALPFAGLIEMVPTTALAGLLIMVGLQLVKITHISTARRNGDIAVYAVTVAAVVFLNLLEGVLIGLALSIVMTVWRVAHTRLDAEHVDGNSWRVTIAGTCTFLCLPRLHRTLESVPAGADVTLMISAGYIDHATRDFIEAWQGQHESSGGTVTMIEGPRRLLAASRSGRPGSLFITCTDPRLLPNSITGSDPGDLFIVRNIGNLVPAGRLDASIEAAITQAVGKLRVNSIVVCGHSGCTAMKALAGGDEPGGDQRSDAHLRTWLMHAETTRAAFRAGEHRLARWAADNGYDEVDQMAVVNVAVQAQIVAQHPLVRDLHRTGRLEVVGLFYDARGARVLRVDTGATPTSNEVKIVNYV